MAKMERILAVANRLGEEKELRNHPGSSSADNGGSDLSASDYHTGSNSDHEDHTDDNDDDGYSSSDCGKKSPPKEEINGNSIEEDEKAVQRCKFPIWSKNNGATERKRRRIDDIGLSLLANQGRPKPSKPKEESGSSSPLNLKKTTTTSRSIFDGADAQSILSSAIAANLLAKAQQSLTADLSSNSASGLEKRLRLEKPTLDANELLLEKLRSVTKSGALNTLSFMNSLKSSSPSPGFRASPHLSTHDTPSPPVHSALKSEAILAGKLGLGVPKESALSMVDEEEDEDEEGGSPFSKNNNITDLPVYSGFGDFGKDSKQTSECTICRRVLAGGKGALEVHMRVHTGEKPFACRYCGSRFTQSASRNRHEKRKSCGTNLQYPGGF